MKKKENNLETSTLLLRKRLAMYVRIVPHDRNVSSHLHVRDLREILSATLASVISLIAFMCQ